MLKSTPVTNADKPVLTADFTKFLDRLATSSVTLASCAVAVSVHPDSDGEDASASTRKDGSETVLTPYAQQRLTGLVEGVDYLVEFVGTFSDGAKETIQILQPCRNLI